MRERHAGAADTAGLDTSGLSHRACHPVNRDTVRLYEIPNGKTALVVPRDVLVESWGHTRLGIECPKEPLRFDAAVIGDHEVNRGRHRLSPGP
jgi:hypothetical protein